MAIFRGIPSSPYYNIAGYSSRSDIFRYYHRAAYVILSFEKP